MFFVNKIFFAALVAVPILVLIYFLHRKVKSVQISSLIFWENQLKSVKSGTGLKAMPLPLKFYIEALMLILLALAAAGPFLISNEQLPTLTVILDDSFSMRAGLSKTPREQAEKALLKMLSSSPARPVQFLLAGPSPRLLDEADSSSGEIKHLLKKWQCKQASADISGALLFARRTFGDKNDILILSDHKPSFKQLPPGMNWFAFGQQSANIAIINASRTSFPQGDKCLIEIVNYSTKMDKIPVKIEFLETKKEPVVFFLGVAPGKKAKHIFRLPIGTGSIKVSLSYDLLKFDNSVVLLPGKRKKLRVQIKELAPPIKKLLEKTLKMTGQVSFSSMKPHLLFSGRQQKTIPKGDRWQVIISNTPKSKAYIGPYTIDRQHPLCYGLQLDGVIWGAGSGKLPGKGLILAGNTPLVSDLIYRAYRHLIFIKFSPKLSTLQDSPNYPVLIYNLIEWRRKALPGLAKSNYRTGEKIQFNAQHDDKKVTINTPSGKTYALAIADRSCTLDLFMPGDYVLEAGGIKYKFRVNPLSADESDLRSCGSIKLEGEKNENIYRKRFMNIAWMFLLAALAFSVWHLYLTRRSAA
jgi:Aerotolerance regulator N-terminal/von Willebrand factor type A domain